MIGELSSTEQLRERVEFLKDQLDEAHFRIRGLEEDLAEKRKEIGTLERKLARMESEGVKAGLAEDLFEFWVSLNAKTKATKLTPDRRKAVNAAVKLYGEAEVRKVIAQNAKTPALVYGSWRTKGDYRPDLADVLSKGKYFDALRKLADATPEIEWTEERLSEAHTLLLSTEAVLNRLYEMKGWTAENLENLGVGLAEGRLIFPVRDSEGTLTGVIKYHPRFRDADKDIAKSISAGPRGLFPAPESVESDTIWLVEGEPDAITAHEMWLPGVAIPGVSIAPGEWMARLKGRNVIICFDCDDPGRRCATKLARPLTQYARDVRVVDLDPTKHNGFDLSDWYRQGRQRKTLEEMARVAKPVSRVSSPSLLPQQTFPKDFSATADTRFDRFVQALERKDCRPVQRGEQWTALCPAHDDSVPTLHFKRGNSSPVVADCKAGCEWEQISEALEHPTRGKE